MTPYNSQKKIIGKPFSDRNGTHVLLAQSPKAKGIKAKRNKQDLIKLTSFCTAKEITHTHTHIHTHTQRQPMEWEKIVANNATDKDLKNEKKRERKKQEPLEGKPFNLQSLNHKQPAYLSLFPLASVEQVFILLLKLTLHMCFGILFFLGILFFILFTTHLRPLSMGFLSSTFKHA